MWQDDVELFKLMRQELFTAVVGDVLDKLEFFHQFLPPNIQPLRDDMIVVGRAMPVLDVDYFGEVIPSKQSLSQKPFGLLFEALDHLKPNEVYVATGGSPRYALWGGLMSTRAIHLKAAAAILDGYTRDTNEIFKLNFPVFTYERYGQDQGARGKLVDFRIPIEIEGIRIEAGDILFGDIDGVLVVPQRVEKEAISRALEKVRKESSVKKALEEGMSTVKAFRIYGVM